MCLVHAHTVEVYDFACALDGAPYLVMELIEGRDLGVELETTGPMNVRRAAGIVAQIASALDAMHARSIVHRDLKPRNVVLRAGDFVKVIDFGIAKIPGQADLTGEQDVLGSPRYMAPEQATAEILDGRTDQFALGVILYEMLAGRPAFQADNLGALLYRVLNAEPPPIPGVSHEVDRVVRRALAKDPLGRFASAGAFAGALEDALRCTA